MLTFRNGGKVFSFRNIWGGVLKCYSVNFFWSGKFSIVFNSYISYMRKFLHVACSNTRDMNETPPKLRYLLEASLSSEFIKFISFLSIWIPSDPTSVGSVRTVKHQKNKLWHHSYISYCFTFKLFKPQVKLFSNIFLSSPRYILSFDAKCIYWYQ